MTTKDFINQTIYNKISMANVVDNYITLKDGTVTEIPYGIRYVLFETMKAFIAETGRGARRQRLYRCPMPTVAYGILRRLHVNADGSVTYCCGQDWNAEMAILRDILEGKVR